MLSVPLAEPLPSLEAGHGPHVRCRSSGECVRLLEKKEVAGTATLLLTLLLNVLVV